MHLTLFTIPRAFTGAHAIRQRNALSAWTRLSPRPEIILFCDDPGIKEAADEFGCIHVPDIECNDRGIPYVSEAFRIAADTASHGILCYTNADILFTQSLLDGIALAAAHFPGHFTIVGRRWNITSGAIDLSGDWQGRLVSQARDEAKQDRPSALDYFCYRKGTVTAIGMPKFLVGSPGWDNWLAGKIVLCDIPLIDGTDTIWCIHQEHPHLWPDDGVKYNRGLQWKHGGIIGYVSSGNWTLQGGQVKKVSPQMRVKGTDEEKRRAIVSVKKRTTGREIDRQKLRAELVAAQTAKQMAQRKAELERRERRGTRRAARTTGRRKKSQAVTTAKPPRRVKPPKKFVRRRNVRPVGTVGSPDLEGRVPRRTKAVGFRRKVKQSRGVTDVEAAKDE